MQAQPLLASLELPRVLERHLKEFNDLFPNKVEFDQETFEVVLKEPSSYPFQVASAFMSLIAQVRDITDNLNLVLSDLRALAETPPNNPSEGERRYILLTKLFFYELLRVRDALPRFLSSMETLNIMNKKDRYETRKLLDQQLNEHYLIRNVYLHGHAVPRSADEHKLRIIASLTKYGYEPTFHPPGGSAPLAYPSLLASLASARFSALKQIGADLIAFLQNVTDGAATWIAYHKLSDAKS